MRRYHKNVVILLTVVVGKYMRAHRNVKAFRPQNNADAKPEYS